MSTLNSSASLLGLPPNLILIIGRLVDKKTKVQLAISNRTLWRIFTCCINKHVYPLRKRINIVDLHKLKYLAISNRYYDQRLIALVLGHAPNLEKVFFVDRRSFPATFMRLFLVRRHTAMEFIVLAHAVPDFSMLVKAFDLNDCITVSSFNNKHDTARDENQVLTPKQINRQWHLSFHEHF